ncbi:SgcJ/EcaC family oxidoreductase [Rhodoferax mekongensis]|uniref:SgcJ/EcaC family oxidoreductase n=1 Tax=Rhodoferax mekongensis TaxID=3068341 RepID=A0ABZ0AX37_9BURK|nr:SgcJ/EcaC family oxidoreductase [Rhodoferax sp. TBRC 17307]WNO04214.1 SgcJ/EcaC family oxidoreductase [Rhodoferax sp. TBRC 17307]
MNAMESYAAEADCRALVLQAADAVDRADANAFAALFVADGTLVRPDGSLLQGRAAIAAAYAARDPDRLTQHLVSNQLVTLQPDGAAALVRSKVLLWSGRHSAPLTPQGRAADALSQVGEFVDAMEFSAEGWRIRRREAHFVLFRREV